MAFGCQRLVIVLLASVSLGAAADVAVPALTARVTDLTGTLTSEQRAALEQRLQAFESEGKSDRRADGRYHATWDIAQYSIRVVEQWKLGRKGPMMERCSSSPRTTGQSASRLAMDWKAYLPTP